MHPYDDPGVMAGQGTLALELLEDAPDLDALRHPGRRRRPARRLRHRRPRRCNPSIAVFGVEVEAYAAMAQRLAGETVSVGGPTIAEGIAVRDIGALPARDGPAPGSSKCWSCPNMRWRKRSACWPKAPKSSPKAPAPPGLPPLLAYPERFPGKRVGIAVCGGNIDARILSNVLLRNLLRDGRLLRLHMQIPDRPGVLADIAGQIGGSGGNIIEVSHQRLFASASVQAAELEVMVEARDPAHAELIMDALSQAYVVRRV